MYIQKAEITNIKSIEKFEIEFPNPAGWHVLIGDNGSGKSTIVRAMALALVGSDEAKGLRENWQNWIRKTKDNEYLAEINLWLFKDRSLDSLDSNNKHISTDLFKATEIPIEIGFMDNSDLFQTMSSSMPPHSYFITSFIETGFFSVAYGPFRRFEGGSSEWDEVYNSPTLENLAAHLSIFNESVALTEPIKWLKDLQYKSLEGKEDKKYILENLIKLINHKDKDGSFLQHNAQFEKVSSDGVTFKDGNGVTIAVNQMSDGYRSILSLTFELIRQLVRVYGSELVFKNIEKGEMFIDLPGVVLIDEIDAHLHPTWQTRIGQWFLKYFPQLQFIVTTHSPLVCRACEKGSIWKLAAPGSDEESGEVTGIDRERLIYGNVLDAYGTGVFGENTSISQDSNEMLNRLAELNVKSMMGEIAETERNELQRLKAILPTESKL